MTLIVGIKCADGIVLGADSASTYATALGQQHTIKQQTSKKLDIIGEDVVFGLSGPVGLGQSYKEEISSFIQGKSNRAPWKSVGQAKQYFTEAMWKHAGPAWDKAKVVAQTTGAQVAMQDCAAQTVSAFPVGNEPCLVQFTHQCQPEEATAELPFLSIGSGQPVADPFLAFIRRIFWPQQPPSLSDGVFAALWTITHAIQTQPGGIAHPIRIVTLDKNKNNKWKAEELSEGELGEHQQMFELTEEEMRKVKDTFSETGPTSPMPEKSTSKQEGDDRS